MNFRHLRAVPDEPPPLQAVPEAAPPHVLNKTPQRVERLQRISRREVVARYDGGVWRPICNGRDLEWYMHESIRPWWTVSLSLPSDVEATEGVRPPLMLTPDGRKQLESWTRGRTGAA